jgi:hypothetical protein
VLNAAGTPVSGASILLNGADLRTTGANGKLSAPYTNVTPPYNLTVALGTTILEYQGLQRTNPQISQNGAVKSASISGNVSGTSYPLLAGQGILIGSSNTTFFNSIDADATTGNYGPKTINWLGRDTTTTDLVAVRFTRTGSAFTGFLQSGKRNGVTLQTGIGLTGLDITLDAVVPSQDATLTFDPGAYTNNVQSGLWNFRVDTATFVENLSIPNGGSTRIPSAGGSFAVKGFDESGASALIVVPAVLGGSTNISLPATTLLKNGTPASEETNVSRTPTLVWFPVSGTTLYQVKLDGNDKFYEFFLPGAVNSFTVPSYAAISAGLLGTTVYRWQVIAYKGAGFSPDNLTDAVNGNIPPLFFGASAIEQFISSTTRFTTVP